MSSPGIGPIVSSAHLASGDLPALSEVDFALIIAHNAFQRWIVRGMSAAGCGDLSGLDVIVLHTVQHRERAKRLADICLVLNIEDTHTVTYAIRKLERRGLVRSERSGKEKTVRITHEGRTVCNRYGEIREACLVEAVKAAGLPSDRLSEIATLLRTLSGHYDQAARAAASL